MFILEWKIIAEFIMRIQGVFLARICYGYVI